MSKNNGSTPQPETEKVLKELREAGTASPQNQDPWTQQQTSVAIPPRLVIREGDILRIAARGIAKYYTKYTAPSLTPIFAEGKLVDIEVRADVPFATASILQIMAEVQSRCPDANNLSIKGMDFHESGRATEVNKLIFNQDILRSLLLYSARKHEPFGEVLFDKDELGLVAYVPVPVESVLEINW